MCLEGVEHLIVDISVYDTATIGAMGGDQVAVCFCGSIQVAVCFCP